MVTFVDEGRDSDWKVVLGGLLGVSDVLFLDMGSANAAFFAVHII